METEEWKRKRTLLLINLSVGSFSFGLTLTIFQPTEFLYLKNRMNLKYPDFYFGMSRAFLCISGIVGSFIASVYVDSTKKVRQTFLFVDILCFLGGILYVLYYSVAFILIGQLLSGTASIRSVVGLGEIARVYDAKDIAPKLSILSVFTVLGLVGGPCATFLFQDVYKDFGFIIIDISNVIGLFMAILYSLEITLVYFTFYNVSLLYNKKENIIFATIDDIQNNVHSYESDSNEHSFVNNAKEQTMEQLSNIYSKTKEHTIEEKCDEDATKNNSNKDIYENKANDQMEEYNDSENTLLIPVEKETVNQTNTTKLPNKFIQIYLSTLKTLFQDKNMVFIFMLGFYATYLRSTIVILEPIKANKFYHWQQKDLAIFVLLIQVCGSIPVAIIFTLFSRKLNEYFVYIFATALLLISLVIMALLPYLKDDFTPGTVLLYGIGVLRACSGTISHIILRSMIAKAVPESIQTIADAIRNTCFELGYVASGIFISLPNNFLTSSIFSLSLILCIALAWYTAKPKYFYKLTMEVTT